MRIRNSLLDVKIVKFWLKKFLYIVLSVIIIAISVNMFLGPHDIAAGGLTGLSIILEVMFGFERSIVVLVFNIFILVLTYIFLDKEMFFNTAIGAVLLPVAMKFIPHITFIKDAMLSMIVGSVIFGVAVSILYANQASSGGTSIPPLILQKYFKLNSSIGLFVTDSIVVTLSLLVFEKESFFYSIFSIFITSITMNYIESGINKKKTIFIISDEKDSIKRDLLYKFDKGVTIIPVIGGYTQKTTEMLMVTLSSKYYHQVISLVDNYDKKAFMITNTVSDVHGEGFTYESRRV